MIFVDDLIHFALKNKYEKVKQLRPRLEKMNALLDWQKFADLFPEKESNMGRPAYNKVLMVHIMFLQSWYSISDEELEFQIYDRLSFQQFLDFPKSIPDYSTIWRFREDIAQDDIAERIWEELKRQIAEKGISIRNGKIQDATFIEADPGKKRSGREGRGREAKTSRSRDGTWTKKNGTSHFGFKLHNKVDHESKLIEEMGVTTAKTHDSNVDLAEKGDIIYRDKAYTGTKTKALGNASMKRGNLTPQEELRNKRISKKRCRGEHPYGTMQRSFKAGRTKLTTIWRVYVQQLFVCAAYNLHRVEFLLRMS